MKIALKPVRKSNLPSTFSDCLALAQQQEQDGNTEEAINAYNKCITLKPADEQPYNRLMIIYRKLKEPQLELKVIHAAIAAIEALHQPKTSTKTISRLSNALSKATGLFDKKGKPVNDIQPILKWRKREILLKKRLKKK